MKFIIAMLIGLILVTLLGIVVTGGTFGQRCIDYKGSAYEVCLIRLSKRDNP
jgi:hypothetical protein